MAKAKGEKREFVTRKAFMTAWESSVSLAEVATKTGLKPLSAQQRALKYRKAGVPLKRFDRQGRLNVSDAIVELEAIRTAIQSETQTA